MSKKRDIPHYQNPIIETHCHLDYLKEDSLDSIIEKAAAVGVEKIMTIAVSKDNLATVCDIVNEHNTVYGTQGIHPHDAKDYNEEVDALIRQNLKHEKLLAVGEIGLDYFYEHTDRAQQKIAFEKQLEIAIDLNLPVVIHTREADEDTQAILKNAVGSMSKKGVIHSFTSGHKLAEYCLSEGFNLGFNGICTFNKAENVRDIVGITPIEQTLLETDAPYLTPVPYRGKENAPYYLPFIAEKIAEVKSMDIEEVLAQCYKNSNATFWNC